MTSFHSTKDVLSKISSVNQIELQRFINSLQLKGYSRNTQKTYYYEFVQLLYTLGDSSVERLNSEDLKRYFLFCINTLKLSENQVHSRMNAIKFYFEQVLYRERMFFDIPRPKKSQDVPKYLHIKDVKKLFTVTTNLKHNTMLKLCYGMGLRVSEIVNIRISDIDSKNMQVLIDRGKGKKDRYVNLPQSILEQLRIYYKEYKPKKFLFEGQEGGQYSKRSAQKVFQIAMKKANISKDVGIHALRHSYATHLLANGTDITYIQQLLGHNDIRTTMLYAKTGVTNIKNVRSPLDDLDNII